VAATLSAYSGFLGNLFQSRWAVVFYLGLVFPVACEFFFDSRRLNESGERRAMLLLTLCAAALLLMTGRWLRSSRECLCPTRRRPRRSDE
jgi:hypothetical protein